MDAMEQYIQNIIQTFGNGKDATIPILQAIQKEYQYLPEEALQLVCKHSSISPAEIIGVASFYSQFRFRPVGKHIVRVCVGTACHVKGSQLVFDSLKRLLNIPETHDTDAGQKFTLQKVSCLGCCSLAPAVQIDDVTYGHVTPANAKDIIEDFVQRERDAITDFVKQHKTHEVQGEIRIGLGSCCVASGSEAVKQAAEKVIRHDALNISIKEVGCVGMCHQVPLLEVHPVNQPPSVYARVHSDDVKHIIHKHFKSTGVFYRLKKRLKNAIEHIQYGNPVEKVERYTLDMREKPITAFLGNQIPIATEHRGVLHPIDIEEYTERGGFKGFRRALTMSSAGIVTEVVSSGIRGRGGAGFPTGEKWKLALLQKSELKYVICNGDEGDPGAFMDRMLLESYPYRIIEGMLIAARAVGAKQGFFYIRAEYPLAVLRVRTAIEQCYLKGYLGDNILGTDFCFHVKIKEGAGAFVCGEETALIASIEGKRGFPRIRPPYPAVSGLWGKPTVINNAETLAQIPYILARGHKPFSDIGTTTSKGTKVFALAGKINRGGLIEVPIGITMRQIIENIGGGVQHGRELKAVQIGGPSGGCIPAHLIDTPVDYNTLNQLGAMMGSGGMVVLDENDCMVDVARYFLSFTQSESCGKCTFCRIGTRRMLDILNKFCEGNATEKDMTELEQLANWTKKASLCGLGKTAPNPVMSTLQYFRHEYLAHLEGRCPSGKCKKLITYSVTDNCIGCTICAQNCPVNAISFLPHQKHTIDNELCTRCDICKQMCPQNAIIIT
jgi:NADH:ubiquinone oxidoreductase subunit F (NADH-binding)/NADH:ubiquinone oxidoreductase subunit E